MPRSYRATPTRKLPKKPSFNQLKKQAKDLLKACQAGDETAINEVRRSDRTRGANHKLGRDADGHNREPSSRPWCSLAKGFAPDIP